VPLKLLSISVEKGDLEYVHDCYEEQLGVLDSWMDPSPEAARRLGHEEPPRTVKLYAALRGHVSLCRKTLSAALEDGIQPIRQWMDRAMRSNVNAVDLVHERSVWVDDNELSSGIVKRARGAPLPLCR
jgi:hypothetical protein